MADIYIDVDVAQTELPVNKYPIMDVDGLTIDEGVTYDEAGMDLNWNFITSAGSFTQTNVVPTTAGTHDWTHQGNGMYTIEVPASGGTINNDTEGHGWFSGKTTADLPFISPIYGFRAAALNNALMDGGDTLDVNVTTVSDTAQTGGDIAALVTTVDTVVDGIQTDLSNGTDGLGAIKTDTAAILVDTGTTGVLVSSGTGTGQIQLTGGIADANLRQWIGTAPLALTSQHVQSSVAAMQTDVITAAATAADCIDASALATDAVTEIVNAIKAAVVETEGSYTIQQVLSILLSVLAGVTSNSGNTLSTPNGNATRVAATVSSNTRTAMTLTPSS